MGLDIYFRKVCKREVGHFRKVNFLVKFFESRYKQEISNCEPITVSEDDIIELRSRCKNVLENHELAPSLLPTTNGFFFGSTAYDDWYFKDVQSVLEKCDDLLIAFQHGEYIDCDLEFIIWY